MGLFDFLKKKNKSTAQSKSDVLLAMLMFNNSETFELYKVEDNLKNSWDISISEINGDGRIVTFKIENEIIGLVSVPLQIPWQEIEHVAQYAYNWKTSCEDLKTHDSHTLVTLMGSESSASERFKILTKVLSSILESTQCVGIYMRSQNLLIPRAQFLESAELLKKNELPLNIWVYIGLHQGKNGNSGYTIGMTTFGKYNIEIVEVEMDLDEIYYLLSNICAYVIDEDITFRDGETLGYTVDQKIKISISSGQFLDEHTIKLTI